MTRMKFASNIRSTSTIPFSKCLFVFLMATPDGPINGPGVDTPAGRVIEASLRSSSPWHKATWGDWEFLPLIDFGVTLLRRLPSKKLNTTYMSSDELEKCRHTSERSNASLCPLQILRGFGALHLLASGKTEKAISDIITKALSGFVIMKRMDIQQELADLYNLFFDPLGCAVIRIYFEDNHIFPYNEALLKMIDERYMEKKKEQKNASDEEVEKKRVVDAVCFAMNPDGKTTVALMENDLMRATRGKIKYVIRHDLAPNWYTRLVLITAFDGTFYWHPPAPVELKLANFYESFTRNPQFRSVVNAYLCDGFFRTCLTNRGVRVVELISEDPFLKMYIFQPTKHEFSKKFMKEISSEYVQHCIDELPNEVEQHKLLIPQFTIVSPLSLRPAFDKPTALFHRPSPFPRAWRIFSPQKAEFSKIVGEPKYLGATYIFPLWDHYHKTKFSLRVGQPEKQPQQVEKSLHQKNQTEDKTQKDEYPTSAMQINKAIAKIAIITRPTHSGESKSRIFLGIFEEENGDAFGGRESNAKANSEGGGDQKSHRPDKTKCQISQRPQAPHSTLRTDDVKNEANVIAPLQKAEPRTAATQKTVGEQPASLLVLSATQRHSASYHPPDVAAPSQSLSKRRPTAPPQSATHISRSHRSSRRSRRSSRSSRRSHRSNRSSRRSRRSNRSSRRSRRSNRSLRRSHRSNRSLRRFHRSNRSARSSRKSPHPIKKPVNQNIKDDMASTQSYSQPEADISKRTVNMQAGGLERQSTKESGEVRIGKTQTEDQSEKADVVRDNQGSSAANERTETFRSDTRQTAGVDFIVEDAQMDDGTTNNKNLEALRRATEAAPIPREKQDRSIHLEFDETPNIASRYKPCEVQLNDSQYDININTPFLYIVVACKQGQTFLITMGRFVSYFRIFHLSHLMKSGKLKSH
uniref:Serpin domain-containing protein n=2 Tax=Parascaris univalens TaxID=6257 RepID=A0A915C1W2_PARUN